MGECSFNTQKPCKIHPEMSFGYNKCERYAHKEFKTFREKQNFFNVFAPLRSQRSFIFYIRGKNILTVFCTYGHYYFLIVCKNITYSHVN